MKIWMSTLGLVVLAWSASAQPSIKANGVQNAAGYQTKLAPGSVFVVVGSGLGPSSIVVATGPNYPTILSGTSITFTPAGGGSAITPRMVYTLDKQAAGVLPSSISLGTYAVRVTFNGQTSPAQNVTVVARSFGIVTANSGGTGSAQANVANVNNGLSIIRFTTGSLSYGGFNWVLTPAHPGDTLTLWGTGGGGDAANDSGGSSGDQTAAGNFVVTVGGRAITPGYAGTSSGYPGLWQINLTLPADIAPDCFSSLQVSAGGELSNMVTISIAAAGQTACSDPQLSAATLAKLDAGGSITLGAFALAKVTVTASGSTINSETISGEFIRFTAGEWALLNGGPKFGPCVVYDRTYPTGGKDPASPEAYLDAGPRIPTTGPGLVSGQGLGINSTPAGPAYGLSLSNGTLAAGTYTLAGPGGTQVAPFTATTTFPSNFTVTNWNSITLIDRTKPLTLNWTGSGFDSVTISANGTLVSGGNNHIVTINCTVPADPGTFSIPTGALSYLPAAGATGVLSVTTASTTAGRFTADLVGGEPIDLGIFAADLEFTKSLGIQ